MRNESTAAAPTAPAADDSDAGMTLGERLYAAPGLYGRHIALFAAWFATCGSLFMSEVLGWIPCLLCWYQRILMYPLAVILLVGIIRKDRGLHWYVLPLSILGILTSAYHYALVMTDWFPPPPCNTGVPCTVDYINMAGALSFVKVPLLALVGFVLVTLFTLSWKIYQDEEDAALAEEGLAPAARALDRGGIAAVAVAAAVVIGFVTAGAIT